MKRSLLAVDSIPCGKAVGASTIEHASDKKKNAVLSKRGFMIPPMPRRDYDGGVKERELTGLFGSRILGDGHFFVGAKDLAQGIANLAERGVGFDGVEEVGHKVLARVRGLAQRREPVRDLIGGPRGAELA